MYRFFFYMNATVAIWFINPFPWSCSSEDKSNRMLSRREY